MIIDTETTQLVMVTYHRPNDFTKCLESLLKNTDHPYHLSIIDNSTGGLDTKLDFNHKHITVYRNDKNIGKGAAFMRWYNQIMKNSKSDAFISIDPDLLLPPHWLLNLKIAAMRIKQTNRLGLLAPVIMNEIGESFASQINRNKIIMHKMGPDTRQVNTNVYYNTHTAGPLFYIDREFFESVGGYVQNQLYGNDDGELCKAARKNKRFIGIVTDVEVLHLRGDSPVGYTDWKRRNVRGDVDGKGYWD